MPTRTPQPSLDDLRNAAAHAYDAEDVADDLGSDRHRTTSRVLSRRAVVALHKAEREAWGRMTGTTYRPGLMAARPWLAGGLHA